MDWSAHWTGSAGALGDVAPHHGGAERPEPQAQILLGMSLHVEFDYWRETRFRLLLVRARNPSRQAKGETQVSDVMTKYEKDWIDAASYETLLSRWRFGEPGSRWFTGETGKYFAEVMAKKRDADPDGAVAASKSIGWDKP
jgi:hypothetical protein